MSETIELKNNKLEITTTTAPVKKTVEPVDFVKQVKRANDMDKRQMTIIQARITEREATLQKVEDAGVDTSVISAVTP